MHGLENFTIFLAESLTFDTIQSMLKMVVLNLRLLVASLHLWGFENLHCV